MNTSPSWDDAQIHAYVDGELDPGAARRLEADSRADVALAARIARQRRLAAVLRGAFDAVLDEPVPQRLNDALTAPPTDTMVTPIGAAPEQRRARPRWSPREWSAMAATLVLGLLVGALAFHTHKLPVQLVQGRMLAGDALARALSTQLSGATPADATRVGLSFRAADGAWCRSFSLSGSSGLACRRQGRWVVQLLEASRQQTTVNAGDYRQAASSVSPAMVAAIGALGGSDALTAEQEQQQLRAGWD